MNKEFLATADKLLDIVSKAKFDITAKEMMIYSQIITKFCKLLDEEKKPKQDPVFVPTENVIKSNKRKK